jgi:TRAP-type C4-dicarboxylate transport system substrate-binding protein
MKFYEIAKYCFQSEHMFTSLSAAASQRAMSKIPADMLPAFLKAAQEASTYQFAQTAAKVKKAADELVKLGVTFTPMSSADRKLARQEVTRKVWLPFIESYPLTKPLIAEIDANRA